MYKCGNFYKLGDKLRTIFYNVFCDKLYKLANNFYKLGDNYYKLGDNFYKYDNFYK